MVTRIACLTLLLAVGGCSIGRVVVNGRGELAFPVANGIVVSKPEADPSREYRLRLGDPHVCQPLILEWDASGRWIAFTYTRHRDGPDAGGVGVLDTATGASHTLLKLRAPRAVFLLAWSPDGDCLAVLQDGRLRAIEVDERRRERTQRILAESCLGFAWATTERVVVAVREDQERVALTICDRDGRKRRLIARGPVTESEFVLLEVRGSDLFAGPVVPDTLPDAGSIRVNLGDGRLQPLFPIEAEVGWFTVSPSGRRVAYLQSPGKDLQVSVREVAAGMEEAEILGAAKLDLGPSLVLPFWVGDNRLGFTRKGRHVLLDLETRREFPMDHLLHDIRDLESENTQVELGARTTAAAALERLAQRLPRSLPRPLPVAVGFGSADPGRLSPEDRDELSRAFARRMRDTPALWIPYRTSEQESADRPYHHVLRLRPRSEGEKLYLVCELTDIRHPGRPVAKVEVELD